MKRNRAWTLALGIKKSKKIAALKTGLRNWLWFLAWLVNLD